MGPTAHCLLRNGRGAFLCRLVLAGLLLWGFGVNTAGSETCSSCSDCSSKLTNPGAQILLAQNITATGDCIVIQAPDVFFDGGGHTITGNNTGKGIVTEGYNGATIHNCKITNFQRGVHLLNTAQNTLTNNLITYTQFGIMLENADDNTLDKNTIHWGGNTGILMDVNSTGNRLTYNESCSSIEASMP